MRKIAFFDFDGTITHKDSFLEFLKFYKGHFTFYLVFALLSPLMLLYKLKIFPNWKTKELVLKIYFKGEKIEDFEKKCKKFADIVIPAIIRNKALKAINDHLQNNERVVIVSASAENWLSPWTQKMGIELIGTKIEVKDGKITGKIAGKNCYGPEKAKRIHEIINLQEYAEICAYGDSEGDRELLELATHKFYRFF